MTWTPRTKGERQACRHIPKQGGCPTAPSRCMIWWPTWRATRSFHSLDQRVPCPLGHARGDHTVMLADLVIGFKMFRERFLSRGDAVGRGSAHRHRICRRAVQAHDLQVGICPRPGWRCGLRGAVRRPISNFKNKILQGAAGLFFHEAMQRIVRAFETRARSAFTAARARPPRPAPRGRPGSGGSRPLPQGARDGGHHLGHRRLALVGAGGAQRPRPRRASVRPGAWTCSPARTPPKGARWRRPPPARG